jgi:predicted lipoprotein
MKNTLALFVLAVCAVPVVGCGDEGTAAPATDYSALLRNVSEQVAMPAHQAATTKTDALVVALQALETAPAPASLQAAQDAWRAARGAYRTLDVFSSFGPVPTLAIDVRIDASPADPAGIEQSVSAADPITADFVGRLGGKKKGFLALEYLLFKGNGADVLAGFTAGGRRGTLARALGDEIAATMHQLLDAWDPAKNGWAKELTDAGKGGHYTSQLEAVNDLVGGGAFALELVVGTRLALPLGRKAKGTPDPSQDPTLASDSAMADMTASMAGVQALYQTPGFTTLIRPKIQDLDDKAVSEMSGCIGTITAIQRPFATSVTQSNQVVQAAFDACKAFKLTWNTDVTSTLGANVKPLDSDGD